MKDFLENLPRPSLSDLQNFNGTLVIPNESIRIGQEIEMQPMNRNGQVHSTSTLNHILHMPPDCCPKFIGKRFRCFAKWIPRRIRHRWTYLRSRAHRLVEHRFFEWLIIASILASSSTLVRIRTFFFFSFVLFSKNLLDRF